MGFLSKVFKGVKKTFKKIGKGIKSAFKSIGKFMDKIGIVGQIGLSLLLPGIGQMLSSTWGSMVGALQGYTGVGSSVIQGAGNFLKTATEIAGEIGQSFSTITEGVKNVVGETLKFGANKLGLGQVASGLGERFGSQYLTDLGTSINNASLDSIGKTFNASVDSVMESFSTEALGPDSAFQTARREQLGIADVKDPVSLQPKIEVTPDLTTPDVAMKEIQTDSLLSPEIDVTPPSVGGPQTMGDPSAVVNRKLSVQAEAALDSAFDKEFNVGFTPEELSELRSKQYFASTDASTIPTKTVSSAPFDFKAEAAQRAKTLQDLGVTSEIQAEAAKEGFIDKTLRLSREKLQELPQEAVDKLGKTITDLPSQFARRAAGLDPDPVYNQVSYATVVPTIQEAPMVGSQSMMNPVQYVANNQQAMGLEPFGFNANMYNAATYMNTMRKYGFA